MTQNPLTQAYKQAEKIIKDMGINSAPVKIDDLLAHIRQQFPNKTIDCKAETMSEQYSGQIILYGDTVGILYNSNMPKVRQRFTIAHEIGYFILNHRIPLTGLKEVVELSNNNPIEKEANAFAAGILMPKVLLKGEDIKDASIIPSLAQKYQVSEEAMRFRVSTENAVIGSPIYNVGSQDSKKYDENYFFTKYYPPSEDYEDDYSTAYDFYSELGEDDLKSLYEWVQEMEYEDDYPQAYRVIEDILKEYQE